MQLVLWFRSIWVKGRFVVPKGNVYQEKIRIAFLTSVTLPREEYDCCVRQNTKYDYTLVVQALSIKRAVKKTEWVEHNPFITYGTLAQ